MSGEALYEQYKDALKRGHVASLRGRVDEALLAYAEAARIAPERSTPHASAGHALLRARRPTDALVQYEVALSISPRDEASLLGRAQALAAMDRRADAADAYDVLAEVHAGGGRLADAVDAARRGLELAEGRERRRTLERLIDRLRASEPGEPGRLALERALQVLEGPAVSRRGDLAAAGEPAPSSDEPELSMPEPPAPPPIAAAGEPEPQRAVEPEPEHAEAATPPARRRREPPAGVTSAELAARADAAAESGLPGPAVDALLDLAADHARDGRYDAALDACYAALTFDPDSVVLHLALVDLYADRGWDALAAEKLDLLERLARLDGDDGAIAEVAAARAARG